MSQAAAAPRADPGGRTAVAVDAAIGLVVAGVLLAGLARPGFPLLRDWVATPDPPLSDAALGLGESAARAVPQDVAVVWASRALGAVGLPAWPLTGALTAVSCVWLAVAAGALARRVLPATRAVPGALLRLPAVLGAVWNPYVVERLLQGHWSLLAGAAAVVSLPVLLSRARPRVAAACAAVAAAGLTPTGWVLAVIAAAVAVACAPRGGRTRSALATAGVAVVTALPWLVATLLAGPAGAAAGSGAAGAGTTGVEAFAARAETGIGTVGSVVASGGIWNAAAVPPSRATWWAAVALALLVAVWALAAPGLWRARREPVVRAAVPVAVAVWLLVSAAATGPGLAVLDALVDAVPAAGLVRDTQKFVALALPATVLALAVATRALARWLRPAGAAVLVAAVAVASVPDAPAALWSALRPVTYGPGWAEVDRIVAGEPGDVLVLPAGSFRSTPLWAGGAPVLDPAPRLLDARVLVPGDLLVGGAGGVAGEGSRARAATDALLDGADPAVLAGPGVRWVLDERTSAGPRGESGATLESTTTRYSDPELTLHEITAAAPQAPPPASPAARAAVLAAHAAWMLVGFGAALGAILAALPVPMLAPALRRRRARGPGR